jgi:hypothetical protein
MFVRRFYPGTWVTHKRLCRVKNMLAMYLKYHKAGLTPTTPVTSIAISPVKMSIGRKSLTTLRSEMIFLQGKPVFYIFLPSTPPYWQIIFRFCWQWQQSESRSRTTYFRLSVDWSDRGSRSEHIFDSTQAPVHGRQNITLHWINGIIRNNKCIFSKLNAVFILKTAAWTKKYYNG